MTADLPSIIRTTGLLIALAANCAVQADEELPTRDAILSAVVKSLPLLELGAKGSIEQRKQCFNCHNQGMPIMALTADISPGGRNACRDAGMDGFLLKPVDPVRLEEMFSAMFPSGSGVSHTEAA